MTQITPYLTFTGNAKEALDYYKDVFEGEITDMQTFGQADHPSPPEAENLVMHARFRKEGLYFMVSDSYPGQEVSVGSNISLALELDSEADIQKYYDRLSEKGTVLMELNDTFWGAKYGQVKDAFGILWQLNYTKE